MTGLPVRYSVIPWALSIAIARSAPSLSARIVGRDDHILHGEERIVISRRLLLKHIQASPGDLAGLQGLDHGGLVDHGTPGRR